MDGIIFRYIEFLAFFAYVVGNTISNVIFIVPSLLMLGIGTIEGHEERFQWCHFSVFSKYMYSVLATILFNKYLLPVFQSVTQHLGAVLCSNVCMQCPSSQCFSTVWINACMCTHACTCHHVVDVFDLLQHFINFRLLFSILYYKYIYFLNGRI